MPIAVAAAGLPQIPKLTGEARTYAERLFVFTMLGNLSDAQARAALVEPALKQGVDYSDEAAAAALEWTGNYPFYIQQLGKHAWNLAPGSPIDLATVEQAMVRAQESLDASIYEVRLQRATEAEIHYMRAMAELGSGPYRSEAVAALIGKKASSLTELRKRLINKGLIYAPEDRGDLDFTIPRFDDYLRRRVRWP